MMIGAFVNRGVIGLLLVMLSSYFVIGQTLQLQVDGYTFYDQAVIKFDPDATVDFDPELDAYKKWGDLFVPMIYTKSNIGEDISINSLPELLSEVEIPLYLKTKLAGTYVLTVTQYTFEQTTIVMLIDNNDMSEDTLVAGGSYSFQSTADYEGQRFTLVFKPMVTDNRGVELPDYNIWFDSEFLNIYGNVKGDELSVYDNLGRLCFTYILPQNKNKIFIDVPPGVYTLVISGATVISKDKIFIY